jgi:hypothetical protein
MKIVIDGNGLVSDEVAVRMALQVLDRDDAVYRFSDGFAVEVKTSKTQRSFKVVVTKVTN